jgi:hypothetical protein
MAAFSFQIDRMSPVGKNIEALKVKGMTKWKAKKRLALAGWPLLIF